MTRLPATSDQTSDNASVMRDFYERHPYPPPVRDLGDYRRIWGDPNRRRVEAALYWPHQRYRADRQILVAGCGTSQGARHAIRWPDAQVTAFDISATGIRETLKLKKRYKLDNLDVVQCRVEDAGELGHDFDHVVCTGVIHHLPDPEVGLRALRSVMAPHGAMQLMVYAPYGRAGIYMLQEYFRRTEVKGRSNPIKSAQKALAVLPRDHPLAPLLAKSPDFATDAGFADALLNPIDRPFSVPEFFHFLEEGGLKFGRWLRQAPYLFECGQLAASPDRARMKNLEDVNRYAAAELFRGRMVEHTAIVYRDDLDIDPHAVWTSVDALENAVPLKMPTSITVRDRLPPGAAAVLINSAHTFTDLYLPVDARQLALFETINGTRTARDVLEQTSDKRQASEFLKTLWLHDQIVFETLQ